MCDPHLAMETAVANLSEAHTWSGRASPDHLKSLPNYPAVVLLTDEAARPVQLLTTQQLKRLAMSRLTAAEASRGRADLAAIVRGIRWRRVHCAFEGRWWYYRLARVLHPQQYRKLVSFGPAWFLHVDWTQPIPEIRVTERVWEVAGDRVGPWASRSAAQRAQEGLWDLFDLCRYPEQIRRAPRGTPCAYAEMGRCDAPCDGSVPLDAYVGRCRMAWAFACGGIAAWSERAAARMQQSAAAQRYEEAGQIKQQLEFARTWQGEWAEQVHPVETLNYLACLPVARRRSWKLFLFRRGYLEDGPVLPQRKLGPGGEKWARERAAVSPTEAPAVVRTEQTWLWCQLLFGREAESAIVVRLPHETPAEGLSQRLTGEGEALRSKRKANAGNRLNGARESGGTSDARRGTSRDARVKYKL
jgi:DNA polymerase-3 subunit epsilon